MLTKTMFCVVLLLFFAAVSNTASTKELKIIGKIVPDACRPTLSNNGVMQYEVPPELDPDPGQWTILDKKIFTLSVSCVHSTRLTVKLLDNRTDHFPSYQLAVSDRTAANQYQFGMTTANGENSGGYIIALEQDHAARDSMSILESTADQNAARWAAPDHNALRKNTSYTWSSGPRNMPGRVLETQTMFSIQPVISDADEQSRPSHGSATFELNYL